MIRVGALVTLELPPGSPVLEMPWIITFGPLSDDEAWEPVVCGPYERPHALSLAESVVGDQDLMAVVEPVLPLSSPEEIREDIAAARLAAEAEPEYEDVAELDGHRADSRVEPSPPPSAEEVAEGFARIAALLTGNRPPPPAVPR